MPSALALPPEQLPQHAALQAQQLRVYGQRVAAHFYCRIGQVGQRGFQQVEGWVCIGWPA